MLFREAVKDPVYRESSCAEKKVLWQVDLIRESIIFPIKITLEQKQIIWRVKMCLWKLARKHLFRMEFSEAFPSFAQGLKSLLTFPAYSLQSYAFKKSQISHNLY